MIIAAAVAVLVLWYLYASRKLTPAEVEQLARNRRVREVERVYSFGGAAVSDSFDLPGFKSRMNAIGRFYQVDEPLLRFPAIAGALLKHKKHEKHEWIVFGFARQDRIVGVWLNKGPDGTQVSPSTAPVALVEVASKLQATAVLQFHNHPNSNPGRFTTRFASPPDQRFAEHFGRSYIQQGVAFHAFVVERGIAHQFACWVPTGMAPAGQFVADLALKNGLSRATNFALRRELGSSPSLLLALRQPNASHNLW